ncbi:hypothetical protein ACLESO_23555 [Pyxidicoccus sp. 3LG]
MKKPDAKSGPRALFVKDLVPVRSGPRPAEAPRGSQVTTMMVGEETDTGDTQR